jgi:hypothetical protein
MDLGLRRLVLVLLSIGGGIVGLVLIFLTLNLVYSANVTLARYGYTFAVLTVIPLALFVAIWLDHFMGTNLLPTGPEDENSGE